MPHLMDKKNVDMLTSLHVYTEDELRSRRDIILENYCKSVVIEANTMVDMARTQIALPLKPMQQMSQRRSNKEINCAGLVLWV